MKLETKKWSMRINVSLVTMCIIDTWLVMKQAT